MSSDLLASRHYCRDMVNGVSRHPSKNDRSVLISIVFWSNNKSHGNFWGQNYQKMAHVVYGWPFSYIFHLYFREFKSIHNKISCKSGRVMCLKNKNLFGEHQIRKKILKKLTREIWEEFRKRESRKNAAISRNSPTVNPNYKN